MEETPTGKPATSRFRHTPELHDRIKQYATDHGITFNAALNVLVRAGLFSEAKKFADGSEQ